MLFIYKKKLDHKSTSGHTATGMSWQQGGQIRDLFAIFFKNKQIAFFSKQLLFLLSKHLDTMANVMDCGYGKTNFWEEFVFWTLY